MSLARGGRPHGAQCEDIVLREAHSENVWEPSAHIQRTSVSTRLCAIDMLICKYIMRANPKGGEEGGAGGLALPSLAWRWTISGTSCPRLLSHVAHQNARDQKAASRRGG